MVGAFVFTIVVGAALFTLGFTGWRGLPRSFRPRYGSVAGAGPAISMSLGAAFVFASVRYLTAGPVGVTGSVIFFVLLGLCALYMISYATLGVPDGLRPRPQRGRTRPRWSTPDEDAGAGEDAAWADSVLKRKPRRRQ